MRRDTARFISVAALVASLAVLLLMAGNVLSDKGIDWIERLANITAAAIPIGALIVTFARRFLPWPGPKVVEADESFMMTVRDDLAATLMRQIIEDEGLRRVSDPWPLPVRWVLHSGGSTTEGVFENLAGAYTALTSQRMVILGAAGAGKSVLLSRLAKDLLVVRKAGQSVPFILSAPTWMPGDSLPRWLARELARRHPGLGTGVKTQASLRGVVTLAEILAADGVVPLIDGLDELAEPNRAQIIREINAYGSDKPLVVTSRPEEFHDATLAGGRRVSRAAVGELLPLTPAAAMEYLAAATSTRPAGRWTEVFDRLRNEPDGVLAQVLTNPLMLWLTRTIYEDSTAEPAELATSSYSADRIGVEQHLLEHLVPAVYRRQDTRWDVRKAQRWLGFLATWMTTSHTQDIAWWRLVTTVPAGRILGAIVRVLALSTVLCGLLVWAGLSLVLLPNLAMQGPLGQGGVGTLANLILSLLVPFRPVVGPLVPAVAGNTYLTLFVWVTGISLLVALTRSLKSTEHQQPKTLRIAPNQLLLPALKQVIFTCLITMWVLLMLALGFLKSDTVSVLLGGLRELFRSGHTWLFLLLVAVLSIGLSMGSICLAATESAQMSSPTRTLHLDRRASIFSSLLQATIVTIVVGLVLGGYMATAIGIYLLFALAWAHLVGGPARVGDGLSSAYSEARLLLAVSGRMPWRVQRFLADAHTRGVFRQVGGVYQFRHLRLRDHLGAGRQGSETTALVTRLLQWCYARDERIARWYGIKSKPLARGRRLYYADPRKPVTTGSIPHQPRHVYPVTKHLNKDEMVLVVSRQHWITLIPSLFVGLTATPALGYFTGTLARTNHAAAQPIIVAWILILFWVVWRLWSWYTTMIVLTDRNLILVDGAVSRRRSRISLLSIMEANLVQTALGGRLGYASLTTSIAANSKDGNLLPFAWLRYLPEAVDVYVLLLSQLRLHHWEPSKDEVMMHLSK